MALLCAILLSVGTIPKAYSWHNNAYAMGQNCSLKPPFSLQDTLSLDILKSAQVTRWSTFDENLQILWDTIDVDCDGVLSEDEKSNAIRISFGESHPYLQRPLEVKFSNYFFLNYCTAALVSAGRIDWRPLKMQGYIKALGRQSGFNMARTMDLLSDPVSHDKFLAVGNAVVKFGSGVDRLEATRLTDGDGCVSQDKWDASISKQLDREMYEATKHDMKVLKFADIIQYFSNLHAKFNRSTHDNCPACVSPEDVAIWSESIFAEIRPRSSNWTALCNTSSLPTQQVHFTRIKAGVQCKSAEIRMVGQKASAKACAIAVAAEGGRYFIFGTGAKSGRCFQEYTSSATCPEGWEDDQFFDFYEVQVLVSETGNLSDDGKLSDKSIITFTIIGAAGFGSILILVCVFAFWYRRKNSRRLDEAHHVRKLLKAKIDTWCMLDYNLKSEKSSLEPSFVHCLGLNGFPPGVFCLFEIVHPEDIPSLQSSLTQLKASRDKRAFPVMAKARLEHGPLGKTNSIPVKAYKIKYIPFEILMSWSHENSILVGLTDISGSAMPVAVPLDLEIDQALNPQFPILYGTSSSSAATGDSDPSLYECEEGSRPDNCLNGSDLASATSDDATTFRSMYAKSHRGGQMVAPFAQAKACEFHFRLDSALAGVEANLIESSIDTDAPSSSDANRSVVSL